MSRVKEKLGRFSGHPQIAHWKFVADHTRQTAKVTIPSPSALHFRQGRAAVPEAIYPDMADFYRDLGALYAKVVRGFADAGCRYLQLDEVNLAYLCDPVAARAREGARRRSRHAADDLCGHDQRRDVGHSGRHDDHDASVPRQFPLHLRGERRLRAGRRNPVQYDHVHGYFMEYDSERAGGFEPLRFLPKGKTVVLGLVTSKTGQLESRDTILRRIEEAAKFAPLDQLALSPQCGFASTEEGNTLAEDEQWAKLRMIVEIAEEVWGNK